MTGDHLRRVKEIVFTMERGVYVKLGPANRAMQQESNMAFMDRLRKPECAIKKV
jgi:hypothetical protein